MEKIALLFPGQGSQYVGMSKTIYDQFDIVKQTFEEASDTLGFDLAKLCFEGSLADLGNIDNALVALLTVSVGYFRVYMKEIGIKPQFCVGHSMGEYSALTCSGVIRFADALKIVYTRSKIAQDITARVDGAMTIVDGLAAEVVTEECSRITSEKQLVAISCNNSLNQVAVSGHLQAVQKVEDRVLELGGIITPLIGNPPFHSLIMQPAADQLKNELEKYTFHDFRYPVISNVTATPYIGPKQVVEILTAHMVCPVQWRSIMENLNEYRVTMTIEMGPKNVLSALLKLNYDKINTLCFDKIEDRRALFDFFSNNALYQKQIPTVITKSLAIAVATMNSNFNQNEYQKGVIEPYRKIRAIQNEIETKGIKPDIGQMQEVLKLLRLILNSKKLPLSEQQEWFDEIFEETGTSYLFNDIKVSS